MNDELPSAEAVTMAVQYARTPLPKRPRLAPWVTWIDLGDDRLQFRSAEHFYLTLRHPFFIEVFHRIAPLLDGGHAVAEIGAAGGEAIQSTTVVFLLQMLAANGLLQDAEADDAMPAADRAKWERQLRFLGRLTSNPIAAHRQLSRARVGVLMADDLGRAIASELEAMAVGEIVEIGPGHVTLPDRTRGLGDAAGFGGLDLVVAGQEAPGFELFDALNAACLESGARWMHVSAVGSTVRVGPTFIPHQTACYTCFDLRRRAHEQDLNGFIAYRERVAKPGEGDEGMLAPLRSVVAGQAALEAMRLLTGFAPPATLGRFYEFDTRTPMPVGHEVLRVPRCPSCAAVGPVREAWESAALVASGRS
jgi:bacteriocin biosynthesis cyclodehydratase domain-containing protein